MIKNLLFLDAKKKRASKKKKGFTLTELIIVIIVLGILITLVVVSYPGIIRRASVAAARSELGDVYKQLAMFSSQHNVFPVTIDCSQPESATNLCIQPKENGGYNYQTNPSSPTTFCIDRTIDEQHFSINYLGVFSEVRCPTVGLDAEYYSNSDTDWEDTSGYLYNATLENGAVYDLAYRAIDISSNNGFIAVPNTSDLSMRSVTVAVRFYLKNDPDCNSKDNWRNIVHKGPISSTSTGFDIVLKENRQISWDTGRAALDEWKPDNLTIPVQEWVYLATTYNEDGTKKIYLNGSLFASKVIEAGALKDNSSDITISQPSPSCPNGNGGLPGYISNVGIYDDVLTDNEIRSLYEESL